MKNDFLNRWTDWFAACCRRRPGWVVSAVLLLCAATVAVCMLTGAPEKERFDTLAPRDWVAEILEEEIPSGETLLRTTEYREGHAVVAFRNTGKDPETVIRTIPGLEKARVASSGKLLDGEYLLLDVVREGEDTASLLDRLNACADVIVAEPDYALTPMALTDDPFVSVQWSYDNAGQFGGTPGVDINPKNLWAQPSAENEIVVADLDLGTDYLHEDLMNRMWVNRLEIPDNGIDDDGNGIIDDVYGANFLPDEPTGDPMPVKGATHGTHTAGIVNAEANNGIGIAGVAGNADNVKLMALAIGDAETLSYYSAIRAYQYIYEMMTRETDPVRVVAINDSWGGSYQGVPYLLESMINKVGEAGALSVIATGNESKNYYKLVNEDYLADRIGFYCFSDGDDWNTLNGMEIMADFYGPSISGLDSEYAIRVAAVDSDGNPANFSNTGWMYADIAAPGTEILSTVSDDTFLPQTYSKEKTDALCAAFITEGFSFRVNPADPYGNNSDITVENNVKNGTAFPNLTGDTETSVNITVRNAQTGMPYLVELPYTAKGLVGEQAPLISFNIKALEYPTDWEEAMYATPHLNVWDCAADEEPFSLYRALATAVSYQDEEGGWISPPIWAGIIRTGVWAQERYASEDRTSVNRVLRLYIIPTMNGDITISLDNVALTRGMVGEETQFGKYDYMNGTSMAAPTVTGAVALLASRDSSLDTALKLKEAVLNRTRQVAALDNLVARSAMLDLDALQDYGAIPQIHSISYEDGVVTVTGETLENVTGVTVDGKSIAPIRVSAKEIVLSYFADEMRNYMLRVNSPAGYSSALFLGHSGEKYTTPEKEYKELANLPDYNFTTDGERVYTLDHTNAAIRSWIPDPKDPLHLKPVESIPLDASTILDGIYEDDPLLMVGLASFTPTMVDSFFWADGKICFTVNDLDTESDPDCEMPDILRIPVRSQLVEIDCETKTQKVYALPEGLYAPAVARTDGKYILAGGYDMTAKTLTNACYIGDGNSWEKVASLPEIRAFGKLTVADGKVYYTGGADETSTDSSPRVPSMLVWDGSSWRNTGIRLGYDTSMTRNLNRKTYAFFQCSVSALPGGLLFTDRVFTLESGAGAGTPLGDTVRYDTASGALTAYNVYYHESATEHCRGLVVGDMWRGMSLRTESYTFEETGRNDLLYHNTNLRLAGEDRCFPLQRRDIAGITSDLKIILTSEDGKVDGFVFRVLNGGKEIARAATGEDGVACVPGLPAGIYTVEELPDATGRYAIPAPRTASLGDDPITTVRFYNQLKVPLTGDPENPALWMMLLLCALLPEAVVCGRRMKRTRKL